MEYRHEWKHVISYCDLLSLRQRLRVLMQPDPHAGSSGSYLVRSLYFDTPEDKALLEKIDGVNIREKFRIRYYNRNQNFLRLEKKSKRNGLGNKQVAELTPEEAQSIVAGQISWMADCDRPLIVELYSKMCSQCLRPKTIVEYIREPFVYGPGNVRITLDYNIRTGLDNTDFLNDCCVTIPAGPPVYLLEVKWDAFLPSVIQDAVQLGRRSGAFSKYRICRIYG